MNNTRVYKFRKPAALAAWALILSLVLMAAAVPSGAAARIDEGENVPAKSDSLLMKMSFNNETVLIRMHDNPTSQDFLSQMPLTVTLEDYNRTEKIGHLPKKLTTKGAPSGSDPSAGDFTYYAPWGNLAIFYRDFGYSNGLIIMGRIESGLEKMTGQKGDFQVTFEIVE